MERKRNDMNKLNFSYHFVTSVYSAYQQLIYYIRFLGILTFFDDNVCSRTEFLKFRNEESFIY